MRIEVTGDSFAAAVGQALRRVSGIDVAELG
jgi:hypothetical protein